MEYEAREAKRLARFLLCGEEYETRAAKQLAEQIAVYGADDTVEFVGQVRFERIGERVLITPHNFRSL